MFSIISSASFLLLAASLIYHCYIKQKKQDPEISDKKKNTSFLLWLKKGLKSVFKTSLKSRLKKVYPKKLHPELSVTGKIVLSGLGLSFIYLFLSGFYFSLFSLHRMFGIPLMFHIITGAFFAVLLCLCLFLYAEKFSFSFSCQNVLFWLFMLSGFFLVTTALCLMPPIFVYQTQIVIFELHRYSALVSVLTGVLFLYAAFRKHEQR